MKDNTNDLDALEQAMAAESGAGEAPASAPAATDTDEAKRVRTSPIVSTWREALVILAEHGEAARKRGDDATVRAFLDVARVFESNRDAPRDPSSNAGKWYCAQTADGKRFAFKDTSAPKADAKGCYNGRSHASDGNASVSFVATTVWGPFSTEQGVNFARIRGAKAKPPVVFAAK